MAVVVAAMTALVAQLQVGVAAKAATAIMPDGRSIVLVGSIAGLIGTGGSWRLWSNQVAAAQFLRAAISTSLYPPVGPALAAMSRSARSNASAGCPPEIR